MRKNHLRLCSQQENDVVAMRAVAGFNNKIFLDIKYILYQLIAISKVFLIPSGYIISSLRVLKSKYGQLLGIFN